MWGKKHGRQASYKEQRENFQMMVASLQTVISDSKIFLKRYQSSY
jgi:hypothetical protein